MRALLLLFVSAMLTLGCGATPGPIGGGPSGNGVGSGAGAGGLPPVGVVWFGTSFDPGSLTVSGQSTTLKVGSPIAAVGHFLQPKPAEDLTVLIQQLGTTVARVPLPAGESAKAFGIDLSAQNLRAGNYQISFVDTNRRSLAAGNLVITP